MNGEVFVLGILLLVVVCPIWILAHYITRWRSARALSRDDERMLAEIWDGAHRMELRIEALERILDAEAPGWRGRMGAEESASSPWGQTGAPWGGRSTP